MENKLENKFSASKIISTLQGMNSIKIDGLGYKQIYGNSELAKALCEKFDLKVNEDFMGNKKIKKILNLSKN